VRQGNTDGDQAFAVTTDYQPRPSILELFRGLMELEIYAESGCATKRPIYTIEKKQAEEVIRYQQLNTFPQKTKPGIY
jgi:hypothetical protein